MADVETRYAVVYRNKPPHTGLDEFLAWCPWFAGEGMMKTVATVAEAQPFLFESTAREAAAKFPTKDAAHEPAAVARVVVETTRTYTVQELA